MDENSLSEVVIGAAIEVHKAVGPGLLESAYRDCLMHELRLRNVPFEAEVPIAVRYKGLVVGEAYRADLLVRDKLIVGLKAVEKIADIHRAQLLTYLRLSGRKLGLLINFKSVLLKGGVRRVVNQL